MLHMQPSHWYVKISLLYNPPNVRSNFTVMQAFLHVKKLIPVTCSTSTRRMSGACLLSEQRWKTAAIQNNYINFYISLIVLFFISDNDQICVVIFWYIYFPLLCTYTYARRVIYCSLRASCNEFVETQLEAPLADLNVSWPQSLITDGTSRHSNLY